MRLKNIATVVTVLTNLIVSGILVDATTIPVPRKVHLVAPVMIQHLFFSQLKCIWWKLRRTWRWTIRREH